MFRLQLQADKEVTHMKNNMKMNSGMNCAASARSSAGDTLLMVAMVSFAPVTLCAIMLLGSMI